MKKLFLLLSLTVIALSALAQNIGEALYIYRNDGQFNAFLRDEVQSIEYSYEDVDGISYDEIVTQIVTTADSVYKIPLAAIDSISFIQPETVYQEDVVKIEEDWLSYVVRVEENAITLKNTIPQNMLPKIDDVIVSEIFEPPFETGFSGRVIRRETHEDGIVCYVEPVGLPDIYKNLVRVGMSASENTDTYSARRGVWDANYTPGARFPIPNIEIPIGPVTISFTPSVVLKYIVCVGEPNLKDYVNIKITQKYEGAVKLDCKFDVDYNPDPLWLKSFIPITTGVPGLYGKILFGGFFRSSGMAAISVTQKATIEGTIGFEYSEELGSEKINDWKIVIPDTEYAIGLSGSVSTGLAVRFLFGIIHEKIASADITSYLGFKLSGNIDTSSAGLTEGTLYSAVKDSELNLSIVEDIIPGYTFWGDREHHEVPVSVSYGYDLNHWYLVPEFSNLTWTPDATGTTGILRGVIERNLLPLEKVALGWVLYDEKDEMCQTYYFDETYHKEKDWPLQGIECKIEHLEPFRIYKAYPLVKLFGIEMRADNYVEVVSNSFPIFITNFEQTSSEYSSDGYQHEGRTYPFKYNGATTTKMVYDTNVEDWGYVYEDPDHQIKHISLKGKESPYTDTSYAFYRNKPMSTACLYGYVKYVGDNNYHYGEKKDYPLVYDKQPEATTLEVISVDETTAIVKCGYKEVEPWGGICGIEYWEDTHTNQSKKLFFETAQEEIEITLTDLKPNSLYYYQAFVKRGENEEDVMAMEVNSFTTMPAISFTTREAINKTVSSATLTGSVEGYDPSDERIKFAFFYSTDKDILNSLDGKSVVPIYDGNGTLSADISNLMEYTTYYYTLAIKRGDSDYEPSGVKSFRTSPIVRTMENPTATHNSVTLQGTCSKGITVAGFSIKKDGDTDYTQYSAVPDENGNFSATIDGLTPNTSYAYYAFVIADDQTHTGNEYSFSTKQHEQVQLCPDNNHPHLIDLGLPSGTKWACCNVGATNPRESGGYYAWGETEEKSVYNEETYTHYISEWNFVNIGSDIAGTQYDVAHVKWGDDWHMPNKDQFNELINNCSIEWTSENGVCGQKFVGNNGGILFIPAAGIYYWSELLEDNNIFGSCWSSNVSSEEGYAYCLYLGNGIYNCISEYRRSGRNVRPVQDGIKIQTGDATEVKTTTVKLNGTVENYDKEDEGINFVFLYSTSEDILNSSDGRTVEAICDDNGNLTSYISDLTDYTTYYYAAAYKQGDADYVLGEVKSFKTLPVVTTLDNASTTTNSATLHGKTSKGIYLAGFSVKKDGDTEYTQYSAIPDEEGNFSTTIDGLSSASNYYYYAFANVNEHTYKGSEYSFSTTEELTSIVITTEDANSINESSAILTGSIRGYNPYTSPGSLECYFFISTNSDIDINTDKRIVTGYMNGQCQAYTNVSESLEYNTTYYYVLACKYLDEWYLGNVKSFKTADPYEIIRGECPNDHHPHMIDIGMPSGTKWACCNIGASIQEEYGNFYAWGDVQVKDIYVFDNYPYSIPSKSNTSDMDCYSFIGNDISGTQYDVATCLWNGTWRMPTKSQFEELLSNCQLVRLKHCTQFIGPNGHSIIMPAPGKKGSVAGWSGTFGYYWSASLVLSTEYPEMTRSAWYFGIAPYDSNFNGDFGKEDRSYGFSIRAVSK